MNEIFYYSNLSTAMNDLNNGTMEHALPTSSYVAVELSETSIPRVILLNDLCEHAPVLVSKNTAIVLNGKTLTMIGAAAQITFGENTVCEIDARVPGSKAVFEERFAKTQLVIAKGQRLMIRGGTYEAVCDCPNSCILFDLEAGKTEFKDCTIAIQNLNDTVTTSATAFARGIRVYGDAKCKVDGCTIMATSGGAAYAILAAGEAEIQASCLRSTSTNGQSSAVVVFAGGDVQMRSSKLTSESENSFAYTVMNQSNAKLSGSKVSASYVGDVGRAECAALYNAANASMTVVDTEASATAENAMVNTVYNMGTLSAKHCRCLAECAVNVAYGIYTAAGSVTELCDCLVDVNSNREASCHAISNSGKITVCRSEVFADAPQEGAVGVYNHNVCILLDTNVTGIHSGCTNAGHLYVQGGVYTGWTHGGLYFASGDRPGVQDGKNGTGYLNIANDVVPRCGYSGRHTEALKALGLDFGACVYLGSGTQITAFMDNCTISNEIMVDFDLAAYRAEFEQKAQLDQTVRIPQTVPHAVAFRHLLGEHDNTLYISNSQLLGENVKVRIDNADDGSDSGHRLYVGPGTNIMAANVNNIPDTVFGQLESYRRSKAFFQSQVM